MNGRNPLWTFSGVRQAAWLFFAFLYIPILVLVVLSFNSGQSATLWESFSLKWYAVVANDPEILRAAKNSLLVATLATLASTVLATLAALGMRGRAFRGQTLMNGVLGLPLLVPEIVTAVATLMFFSFIGLKLSLFTILSPTSCSASPSPTCRSAPAWRAWTRAWRRPPPTSTPRRGRPSGKSPCRC